MSSASTDHERLLWPADVTHKSLGISRRTLFAWTKAGVIPCVRIGNRVLYDPKDLAKLIDSLKSGGQVDA